MLQGRFAIEAAEEISDPQRGRICDFFDSMIEGSLPDISRLNSYTEKMMAPTAPLGPTKKVLGLRFLCCCPQLVPFRTNRTGRGRLAPEDNCLLMSDLAEPCEGS